MLYQGDIGMFQPTMRCVGCYLEHEGEVLLLKKPDDHAYYPRKWGVVAGKIDVGEPPLAAVKRELLEEIGYRATSWQLRELARLPVIHPHFSFLYYLFGLKIKGPRPEIRLSAEHQDSRWLAPALAVGLDLIEDEAEVMARLFGLSQTKARS